MLSQQPQDLISCEVTKVGLEKKMAVLVAVGGTDNIRQPVLYSSKAVITASKLRFCVYAHLQKVG